jgi:hypothetical protein
LTARIVGDVQVGAPHVADQERVTAEDEPRLVGPAPAIGDRVSVVGGRVAGGGDRRHERVAELDGLSICERDVLELDAGTGRQIWGRAGAVDQRGQSRDVVCLHVRLEDGDDRCTQRGRCRKVVLDEVGVRVYDREFAVRSAAKQVAGAGAGIVQERT